MSIVSCMISPLSHPQRLSGNDFIPSKKPVNKGFSPALKPLVATIWQHYLDYCKSKELSDFKLKSDSSFAFSVQSFSWSLNASTIGVAEFLRRNFYIAGGFIIFRIIVTPPVVVLTGYFPTMILLRLLRPCGNHFTKLRCVFTLSGVNTHGNTAFVLFNPSDRSGLPM